MFHCGWCGNQAPLPFESTSLLTGQLSCWSAARRSDRDRVGMTHPHTLLVGRFVSSHPESLPTSPRGPSVLCPDRKARSSSSRWGSRLWRSDTAVRSPPRAALKHGVGEGMVGRLTVCVSPGHQPRAAACKAAALLRHCQL